MPTLKQFLSGNEAVARGAWEAGVEVAAGYPGTPSTEILESIVAYDGVNAEWSVNEKVAFEVAYGAAVGGKRSLASMKHVGVNVAADALMTAAYTGVNRGLVLVSADDPGIHSSQNEQDNRLFAAFAKIPMLEPADSAEAYEFTRLAFEISERFDTPVLLRLTTRICHGRGVVMPGDRGKIEPYPYRKDAQKYVMIPAHARVRHGAVEERRLALERYAEDCGANRPEMGDTAVGVVTAGVPYQYAREVLPAASFFKLGLTWPLPEKGLKEFAERVEKLYVVEELEPFLEDRLRAMGLTVIGKKLLPRTGELSPELLREKLFPEKSSHQKVLPPALPGRPPVMCPGCPHRRVFYILKKMKATVTGDIGCYTLSALEPLSTMDTCICMGASVGVAQGFRKALGEDDKKPSVAVLGDSTFIHAGIPALINAVYNQTNITVIVLDNRTTAMTGLQEHPGTGRTLQGGGGSRV
ncbi:thiamine pyrophosphate-dependent enzyme [candidate division KSB1 bacterium]